ncbi:MAG: hypothetical protein PHG40_00650 [Candidatus Omnitrophica bacterium]|nr:hypothetical protein [Candidatus Omnitrophota bacterium]
MNKVKEKLLKIGAKAIGLILVFSLAIPQYALAGRTHVGGGEDMKIDWSDIGDQLALTIGVSFGSAWLSSSFNSAWQASNTANQAGQTVNIVKDVTGPLSGIRQFIAQPLECISVGLDATAKLVTNPTYIIQGATDIGKMGKLASMAATGFATWTAATQVAGAVGAYGQYHDWNPRKIYTVSSLMVGGTAGLINPNAYLSQNNGFQPIQGALVGGFGAWANAATVAAIDGSKINKNQDPGVGAQVAGYAAGLYATELGRTAFDPNTYFNKMQEVHSYKAPDEIYKLQYDEATGTSTFRNGAGEQKTFEELYGMGGTINTDGDMVITHDPALVRYEFPGTADRQTYRQGQNQTWVDESDPNKVLSRQEWEALQRNPGLKITTKDGIATLTRGNAIPVTSEAEFQKIMGNQISDKTRFDPRAGAQTDIYEQAYHSNGGYINKEGEVLSSGEFYDRFAGKPDIQVTPGPDGSMAVTRAVSPESSWRSSSALIRRPDTIIAPTQDGNYQLTLFSGSKDPIVVDEVSGRSIYFARNIKPGFGVNEGRSQWIPAEMFSPAYRPSASTVFWRLGAAPFINTANLWPQILTKYMVLMASKKFEEHNKDNWAEKWKPLIEASIQSTAGPLLDSSATIFGWRIDLDRQLGYYPAMEAYREQLFGQALAKRDWKQLANRPKDIYKQVDLGGVPGYIDSKGNILSTQDVEMLNRLNPGKFSVEANGDLQVFKDPIPDSLTRNLAPDKKIEFAPLKRTPDGEITDYMDSKGKVYSSEEVADYTYAFPNLYFDKDGSVYSLHSPDDAFYKALQNRGLTSEKEQVKILSDAIARKTRMETASEWSAYKNIGGSKWEAFGLAAGNTLRTELPIGLIATAIEIGIDDSTSSDKEDFSHALTASLRNIAASSVARGLVWGLYGDYLHSKQLSEIGKAGIPNEIFPYNLPEDEIMAARVQGNLAQPGPRVTIGEMGFYDRDGKPLTDAQMTELQERIDKAYAAYGAQAPDIRTTDLNTIKEGLSRAGAASDGLKVEFAPNGKLVLSQYNQDFGKYVVAGEYIPIPDYEWSWGRDDGSAEKISGKSLSQMLSRQEAKDTLSYLTDGIVGQGVTSVKPDINGNFRLASDVALSDNPDNKGYYTLQRAPYHKSPLMPNTIYAGVDRNKNTIFVDDPEFEWNNRQIIAFTIKNGEIGIKDKSTIFAKKYEFIPTAGVVPSIVGSFGQSAFEFGLQTIAMGLYYTPGGKMSTLAVVNYTDKLRQLASSGAYKGMFQTMGEYMTSTGSSSNFGVAKDLVTRNILTAMADIPYVGSSLGLAPYVPVSGYKGMPFSVVANVGGGYGEMRTRYYPYWPYDRINIVPQDTFWRNIKIGQTLKTTGQTILPPVEQPDTKLENNND